jgi:hypothetical protein
MSDGAHWDPRRLEAPPLGARRLLLVATGSVSAAFLPFWLNWLAASYPELECQVALTRSAQRFVTQEAVSGLTRRGVLEDAWPDAPRSRALHVELARWADAIAVYPATLHFIGRLALGLADTPVLLAAQCTTAPVGLAAALPPGGWDSAAMARHRAALEERRNVVLLRPVPGLSLTTQTGDGNQLDALPALLSLLEARRLALLDEGPASGDGALAAGLRS